MTSSEKFDILLNLDQKGSLVKIITFGGDEFLCRLEDFSEDEEDWAYQVVTLEDPPRHFILECNFIKSIEEIEMSMSKTA